MPYLTPAARTPRLIMLCTLSLLALRFAYADIELPWGKINEPSLPTQICSTLTAQLMSQQGSLDQTDPDPAHSQPDTARLQAALDHCPAGQAVHLVVANSGADAFLSGPLQLPSQVTLWLDKGVTLFASRSPADYDLGSGLCGTAGPNKEKACRPFILADNTQHSGLMGAGIIDGRGGSRLTSGPHAGQLSWWDLAYQTKTKGLYQHNPWLISIRHSQAFTLYQLTLLNAPNFHIQASNSQDLIAWGLKLLTPSLEYSQPGYQCPVGSTPDQRSPASCFTPETVKNTDGFDPAQSSRVLLAHSFISVGDDQVAVKSHGQTGSHDLVFLHNHFYYGHGLSIGSETDAGLARMLVDDLVMDGQGSQTGIGLRIKSDRSRGGLVQDVRYQHICMRNVYQPLVFDSFYSPAAGQLIPEYRQISIQDMFIQGGGQLSFTGLPDHPMDIQLDNVQLDNAPVRLAKGHNSSPNPALGYVHFHLGPGPVSFASLLMASPATDVQAESSLHSRAANACRSAFIPLHTILPMAPF